MATWLEMGLSNAVLALGLAIVAWLVTRLCRHPKVVIAVWLLVLLKLLAPPLVGIPWQGWRVAQIVDGMPNEIMRQANRLDPPVRAPTPAAGQQSDRRTLAADSTSTMSSGSAHSGPMAEAVRSPSIRTLVAAIWLTGSVLWLLLAVGRIWRFKRTLAHARLASPQLLAEVADVTRRMGLSRVPQVRLVNAQLPPLVWALTLRPTIVLPAALLSRLSTDQRATLLAHELAHLKRRDHLVRLIEMAALALYWWHPVAWWARRQIERAGEACCDAAVIALFPTRARDYAETLLATMEFVADARPALPAGTSGMSQFPLIRRRLEMILAGTVLRRVNWPLRLALVALALLVLPPSIQSVSAEPKAAPPAKAFVPKGGTIEERMDRLEAALQLLTAELRAMRAMELENASPVVVKTVPENGAEDVDPNLTEIKVTFSKDMHDGTWSWTQESAETFPEVTGKIHYQPDKRTCVLPVKLEPGKTYYMSINSERFRNFKDEGRRPAIPYPLSFKTKS
jgi:beta-lactamase regulating signal transducer with metallopeptidase domain